MMHKGGKRILAVGMALALVFGTLQGTGIVSMDTVFAGEDENASSEVTLDNVGEGSGTAADSVDNAAESKEADMGESETAAEAEEGVLTSEEAETEDEETISGGSGADSGKTAAETNAGGYGTPQEETVAGGNGTLSGETVADEDETQSEESFADELKAILEEIMTGEWLPGTTEAVSDETAEDAEEQDEEDAEDEEEADEEDAAEEELEAQEMTEMPQGSLSAATEGGIEVTARFEENVFPEGVTMAATDLSKEDAMDAAADAVEDEVVDAAGADITFFDAEGNEIEPYEGGEVDVSLTLATPLADGDMTVVHVDDEGNAEELDALAVDEVQSTGAVFSATEFSSYLVVSTGVSLQNFVIDLSKKTYTYDGHAKKPVVTFYYDPQGWDRTERTVSYANNVNVGTATVNAKVTYYYRIAIGRGYDNRSNSVQKTNTFQITQLDLNTGAEIEIVDKDSQIYDGTAKEPSVRVKNKESGNYLPASDYEVTYKDNTNAGTATVTVTAKGSNCTGKIEGEFQIKQADLSTNGILVLGNVDNPENPDWNQYFHIEDDKGYNPPVSVFVTGTDGKTQKLEQGEDRDYTVEYKDNIKEGTATATVMGTEKGNCKGTLKENFYILEKDDDSESSSAKVNDLSTATVGLSSNSFTYDGTPRTPQVTVTLNNQKLTENTDYTVQYNNNTNAGTAAVSILPVKEKSAGKKTVTFTINRLDISNATLAVKDDEDWEILAYLFEDDLEFDLICNELTIDKNNYTVSYKEDEKEAKATLTVTGKNNCTGSIEKSFTIYQDSIADAKITVDPTSYTYDGEAKKPEVIVTLNEGEEEDDFLLEEGVDYTVSYSNNVNPGTATVTVTGKGYFTGTKTATFTITQAASSNSSSSSASSSTTSSSPTAASPTVTSSGSSSSSSSSSSGSTYSAGSKGGKADYSKTGKQSVSYDTCKVSSKKKTARVPATVKIGKKTYKVTAISSYAFVANSNLESVTIGKNVKKIGVGAFSGCSKLKTLTIRSKNLTAAKVKNCLKDSSVETIVVPDGMAEAYSKIFTKANTGRGKAVKIRTASQVTGK